MSRLDDARTLGRQLRATRRVFAQQVGVAIKAAGLTDDEVADVADLYDDWQPGIAVAVGDLLRWDGTVVEVIQAHTTQIDWEPPDVPALFRIFRTPDMTEWIPGIAVQVGEQFTYLGTTYQVLQAHTTQVGWEPPAVPALWAVVT